MLAALCLAAGSLQVQIAASQFTLRWQHSIEKIAWEEDYVIAGDWLLLSRARLRGSGAGMEPPAGAYYERGIWHYRAAPDMRWTRQLVLTRSEFTPDYELCVGGRCQPLSHWIAPSGETTTAAPCPRP